jgi:hypothetical protein
MSLLRNNLQTLQTPLSLTVTWSASSATHFFARGQGFHPWVEITWRGVGKQAGEMEVTRQNSSRAMPNGLGVIVTDSIFGFSVFSTEPHHPKNPGFLRFIVSQITSILFLVTESQHAGDLPNVAWEVSP